MKKLFLRCLMRFRVWCYRARKIAMIFGLIIAILMCSIPFASAESSPLVGDQLLFTSNGNTFVRFYRNSSSYIWKVQDLMSPYDVLDSEEISSMYVPADSSFINFGCNRYSDSMTFAPGSRLDPGEVITISCTLDSSYQFYQYYMSNASWDVQWQFEDGTRFFYTVYPELTVGDQVLTLTYKNDTGRSLSIFNVSFTGYFDSNGAWAGGWFRLSNFRYHVYTAEELSSMNIEQTIKDQTDKITDGYEKDPILPDNSGDFGELEDTEGDLMDSVEDGLTEAETSVDKGINGLTYVSAGLSAIRIMFVHFELNTWISALLWVSLFLGLFTVLLNLGTSFIRGGKK